MAKRVKSEDKPTATINDWLLERSPSGSFHLTGKISDHPRQGDFSTERQQTSNIVEFNNDKGFAETQNTRYTLGTPFKITKVEEIIPLVEMASEVIQEIGDAFAAVGNAALD